MTRDVASRFHATHGEVFVLPKDRINEATQIVPGTDGEKMSKSRGNIINIFLPEKQLRKQVMSIVTDSKELEDPKDPDTCHIFGIYRLLANEEQQAEMRGNYLRGGYGYGHAKQALYELILAKFEQHRAIYNRLMENKHEIDAALAIGAEKARTIAHSTLERVRKHVGY
jgi:tryptophanyl-tRNA synthetase